jgi:hypothetical protein
MKIANKTAIEHLTINPVAASFAISAGRVLGMRSVYPARGQQRLFSARSQ